MKVQIYISNEFSKYYMPFLLYREVLKNTIQDNIFNDVEYIYNINDFYNNNNTLIIMNLYCLNYTQGVDVFDILEKSNSKVILINTEYYEHHNVKNIINKISNKDLKFFIFEYNIINYKYYKENYKNINIKFIPLLYNSYLEYYYNLNVNNKIIYNKNIDIFFYGRLNERRENLLNILKKKYNVMIITNSSGEEMNQKICEMIKKSKIILNILYEDVNHIFDYYRNSFIISNKGLLISEYPNNIDFTLEPNLIDIENNLIVPKYENIIDTIDNYLSNYNNLEINKIIEKQYEWFKKNNQKEYIIDFFNNNFN
jgi:hypothetical protein